MLGSETFLPLELTASKRAEAFAFIEFLLFGIQNWPLERGSGAKCSMGEAVMLYCCCSALGAACDPEKLAQD